MFGVRHPVALDRSLHALRADAAAADGDELRAAAQIVHGYAGVARQVAQSIDFFLARVPLRLQFFFRNVCYAPTCRVGAWRDAGECILRRRRGRVAVLLCGSTAFEVGAADVGMCLALADYAHCRVVQQDVLEKMRAALLTL